LVVFYADQTTLEEKQTRMKWCSLSFSQNDHSYFMCAWSGALLESSGSDHSPQLIPVQKLKKALDFCHNPYLMPPSGIDSKESLNRNPREARKAERLISLCMLNFFLARQYAALSTPIFPDSRAAIDFFHNSTPKGDRSSLCLPRSLFAAKTSQAFKAEGVIFIGTFLPSRHMHAWVIEDGEQPDPYDKIWHLYKPVAAIY
jgi:hypothetical protein